MRKFSRLSDKIGKKGYSFDPKKGVFCPSGNDKNKTCYNYGEKGTSFQIASSPSREDPPPKTSKYKNQVMSRKTIIRARTRAMRRKRAIIRRLSSSQRRKGKI
jgi:hypothetical protein